ncbi:TPA: hypothetical protein ACSP1O_004116, partial [Aeromonas veronii]
PTPVEPPLPETLVNNVLSISFNTPDCLIVTIGTVCENQDTSIGNYDRVKGMVVKHSSEWWVPASKIMLEQFKIIFCKDH